VLVDPRKLVARVQPSPLLEKLGVGFFRRRETGVAPPILLDAVHVLNADEQRALRRVERGAIARAALAGAISAGLSGAAELSGRTWLFVVTTVVAAAFELAFLYWDGLRSVHRLAREAGLTLFPPREGAGDGGGEISLLEGDDPAAVATALARAALELPNPPQGLLGVDPLRRASRLALVASSLLYKAKIGLTNFLLRALLTRLLGRAALRTYLAFVAVPVTALWNGLVCWSVLREARVRVMGPSAAKEHLGALFAAEGLSAVVRPVLVRALGCAVVSKRDMHPNLAAALRLAHRHLGVGPIDEVDDEGRFLSAFEALPPDDQLLALRVLRFGLVLDGRLGRRDEALWRETLARAGRPAEVLSLRTLRRRFVAGRSFTL
jgi:hypothetical protein